MTDNDKDENERNTYPPVRGVMGEEDYLGKFIIVPNPRWTEIQALIQAGYESTNEIVVNSAIEAMSTLGYEQMLQNLCKEKEIDSCLALAIIIAISGGDTTARGGLFGVGGNDFTEQIRLGIDMLVALEKRYRKGDNLLGWVQSIKRWADDMNIANKETAAYDKDWVGAMKYCKFTKEEMIFFPAVMNAYRLIPTMKSAESQVTCSMVGGVEFPFKTIQLNNIYFIKDHGVTNYGAGVMTAVNGAVFLLSSKEPVYAPIDGSGEMVNGEFRLNGSNGLKYIFNGLEDVACTGGEQVVLGQQLGTCKNKLIIKCIDIDGEALDPYTQWRLLQGKISPDADKSIGQFVEEDSLRFLHHKES